MKTLAQWITVSALLPVPALAAQVYGTVTEGSASVTNREVVIICGGQSFKGNTDEHGSFGINVRTAGRCTLTISGYSAPGLVIYSYPKPVNYRINVNRKADGSYSLDRQ